MASSGEIWILNRIADLAVRCNVSPAVADIVLKLHIENHPFDCYYTLSGVDGAASIPVEETGVAKVWSLLGLDDQGSRRFSTIKQVGEAVDQALAQAPRVRPR